MSAIGVVAFVVALLLSVMLHEYGHFWTARRFGMKATQFFVGFGPTLWSVRRGETEYGVKAIPAGGFVKIVGMTQLEEVAPEDEARAFYRQPARRRAIVLGAGSFMHFVIALVLLVSVNAWAGVVQADAPVVDAPAECIQPDGAGPCSEGGIPGPAKAAGFQAGDRVLSVDGTAVTGYEQLVVLLRGHGAGTARVVVQRGDRTLTLTPSLVAVERPDLTHPDKKVTVSVAGLQQAEVRTHGLGNAFTSVPGQISDLAHGFYDVFAHRLGSLAHLFSPDRDATGFVGVVGIARISGEVTAAHVTWADKVEALLSIVVGLNFFVGVFNLLPLLPLDGGHLAILGFEEARSRLARLLRRPDPGRVDLLKVMPVAYAVIGLMVALTVAILAADIVNPVKL